MRTIVLVAAVGAAAVLGGVVGAGVMRATQTGAIGARLDGLEQRLEQNYAAETDDFVKLSQRIRDTADNAVSGKRANWWCNGAACLRDKAYCERLSQRVCDAQRVAYCHTGSLEPAFGCMTTLERCDDFEKLSKTSRRCLGVE